MFYIFFPVSEKCTKFYAFQRPTFNPSFSFMLTLSISTIDSPMFPNKVSLSRQHDASNDSDLRILKSCVLLNSANAKDGRKLRQHLVSIEMQEEKKYTVKLAGMYRQHNSYCFTVLPPLERKVEAFES